MANETTEKKRKGWYSQSFKDDWLELEDFKRWLKRDEADENSSYCICCHITQKNASKSMLIAHKNIKKHNRNFVAAKSTINSLLVNLFPKRKVLILKKLPMQKCCLQDIFLSTTSRFQM